MDILLPHPRAENKFWLKCGVLCSNLFVKQKEETIEKSAHQILTLISLLILGTGVYKIWNSQFSGLESDTNSLTSLVWNNLPS